MIIETKFNIGDVVVVMEGDRPVHLSSDENNTGKVKELFIGYQGKTAPAISYLVEFKDPDTGQLDPDWDEEYEEDMLTKKEKEG